LIGEEMEFVFGKKKNPQAVQDLVSALRDFEVTGSLYIGYPIFDINDEEPRYCWRS